MRNAPGQTFDCLVKTFRYRRCDASIAAERSTRHCAIGTVTCLRFRGRRRVKGRPATRQTLWPQTRIVRDSDGTLGHRLGYNTLYEARMEPLCCKLWGGGGIVTARQVGCLKRRRCRAGICLPWGMRLSDRYRPSMHPRRSRGSPCLGEAAGVGPLVAGGRQGRRVPASPSRRLGKGGR